MKKSLILLVIFLIALTYVDATSIFLSDYMEEGGTKVYETEDGIYIINLLSVADKKEIAVFKLNNETSKGIKKGDSYVFEDNSEIVVRDLVINEAGEGEDMVYYYFYGTGKDVLKLKNVSKYVVNNKLCNFDGQCLNETKENCCYDCGCDGGYRCENNKCVEKEIEMENETKQEIIEEEPKDEVSKEKGKKKIVSVIFLIILVVVAFVIWKVYKRRRKMF